ncbi:tonB-dependent receptor family protein [Novosphingobium sp. Rr 2-17]|uniref:TonB-dependent receptor n=1 Tax=Novosphingobium sp. Rr 2-17 TaxID=555793 RepID=UPI0002697EE1|nr:TonB-dependent receptor [Novosphingobium sp. Rr 2-17]EIZ78358.1 tonB-dependent receptor family protein [Novosphingobium sp. Rr 2-17]
MTLMRSGLLVATSFTALLAMPAWAQDNKANDEGSDDIPIVVTGIKGALTNAINVKRNADAVVDVITAEGIGKFPDRNVAESLSHIPGVSVDRQFGIGERVSIQGTDPALNRVMIDGHTIASADWGGNTGDVTGRTFNYSLLAPEIVSQIEVYKSPEPRIDEGSLGGTVIVHTRMPLDLEANTITGSAGYNYNDRSKVGNPRGSALYSWKNDSGTFGILVAGTYDQDTLSRAGIEYFGYSTGSDFLTTDDAGNTVLKNPDAVITGGSLEDLANARYPVGINHAYFKQTRKRIGGQFAVQWAPTTDFEVALTGLHIQGTYNNFSRSEFIYPGWATGQLESATISNGQITSASFGSTTLPSTSSELDMNYRKTKVTNDSYNLATTWHTSDSFTLSANGGWTKATGGTDPEYLMNLQSNMPYSYSYSGNSTDVTYSKDPTDPTSFFRTTEGTTSGKYQIGGISRSKQKDEEFYGQLDGKWDVQDPFFKSVRMGIKASTHENSLRATGSQVYYTEDIDLSDFDYTVTPSGLFSGLNATGNSNQFATLTSDQVIEVLKNGEYVDTGIDYGSSFKVREKNASAYVQLDFETGPVRGNVGYRAVYTQDISDYYLYTAESNSYSPARDKNEYLKGLPSINVSWELASRFKLRGSIAKVIARPRYSQLAGAFSRNDTQLTASGGNPDLKPYASTNYELSAEWYFGPSALLSVEYFRREISSYIVTKTTQQTLFNSLTQQDAEYSVSSPVNASNATVNGVSIGFQTPIWGGFGILTNYTYADASSGTDETGAVLNLPYLSRHTINVIPYFEKGGFQARVSWNYRSHYFTSIGRLNSVDSTAGYHQLDASISYKINEHFTVQANAQNLLDSTYYSYSGTKASPTAFYKNGRVFAGAVQFAF